MLLGPVFSSICIKLVNGKTKSFWARTISATHKKRQEKNYLKKWIVAKRPQSIKIDLKEVYTEEYFWRLILPFTRYTGNILLYILKGNFQKPTRWIFLFFLYYCQGELIQISFNQFTSARIWKIPSLLALM